MAHIETVTTTESYRGRCEDRVAVIDCDHERAVIVVADGAGGIGSGDSAAEAVIREVKSALPRVHSADQWADVLNQADQRISIGETTAVVVDVRTYGIAGASVGDSCAWIVDYERMIDLTCNQIRKPLLGSGNASPVSFLHEPLEGVLLVATDGFFNYAKRAAIPPMIVRSDFYSIPRQCLEMVRLPSGVRENMRYKPRPPAMRGASKISATTAGGGTDSRFANRIRTLKAAKLIWSRGCFCERKRVDSERAWQIAACKSPLRVKPTSTVSCHFHHRSNRWSTPQCRCLESSLAIAAQLFWKTLS